MALDVPLWVVIVKGTERGEGPRSGTVTVHVD